MDFIFNKKITRWKMNFYLKFQSWKNYGVFLVCWCDYKSMLLRFSPSLPCNLTWYLFHYSRNEVYLGLNPVWGVFYVQMIDMYLDGINVCNKKMFFFDKVVENGICDRVRFIFNLVSPKWWNRVKFIHTKVKIFEWVEGEEVSSSHLPIFFLKFYQQMLHLKIKLPVVDFFWKFLYSIYV